MKIKRPLRRTPDPSSAGDAAAKESGQGLCPRAGGDCERPLSGIPSMSANDPKQTLAEQRNGYRMCGITARRIALRPACGPTVAFRYMNENLNRAMAGDCTAP